MTPAGTPFGSVVTYGLDPVGQPWFFVSTMAEHTRNAAADPRAGVLRGLLGGLADQPGKRDERRCREHEQRDVTQMHDECDDEGDRGERE